MYFRTFYDKVDVGVTCETPSRTQQSFKDECDINNIVKRYRETGVITHLASSEAFYDDVSNVPDYQTALGVVMDAEEKFMQLPATVRKRFDNDPAQMLEFIQDDNNYEEAVSLGLLAKRIEQAPEASQVSDNPVSSTVPADVSASNI